MDILKKIFSISEIEDLLKTDGKPRYHKKKKDPFDKLKFKNFIQKLNNHQTKTSTINVEERMGLEESPF